MSIEYAATKRRPGEFANRLVEIAAEVLTTDGMPHAQAEVVAREIATRICWEWGGNRVQIQRDPAFGGLTQRDRDIWARYTGNNHQELVEWSGLSWRMVMYVLAHCRRVARAESQPELPGITPDQQLTTPKE